MGMANKIAVSRISAGKLPQFRLARLAALGSSQTLYTPAVIALRYADFRLQSTLLESQDFAINHQ